MAERRAKRVAVCSRQNTDTTHSMISGSSGADTLAAARFAPSPFSCISRHPLTVSLVAVNGRLHGTQGGSDHGGLHNGLHVHILHVHVS